MSIGLKPYYCCIGWTYFTRNLKFVKFSSNPRGNIIMYVLKKMISSKFYLLGLMKQRFRSHQSK